MAETEVPKLQRSLTNKYLQLNACGLLDNCSGLGLVKNRRNKLWNDSVNQDLN